MHGVTYCSQSRKNELVAFCADHVIVMGHTRLYCTTTVQLDFFYGNVRHIQSNALAVLNQEEVCCMFHVRQYVDMSPSTSFSQVALTRCHLYSDEQI